MKNILKKFLEKIPKLYFYIITLHKKYHNNKNKIKYHLFGTKMHEEYWTTRHLFQGDDWGNKTNDFVKAYWDSKSHSHRSFLIQTISKFSPSSLLEIGCNCGPNLFLLAKKFPNAKIVGIDINPQVIQRGNELFAREGISNVELFCCKADDLSNFENKSFDIVFTDAVLLYIGPDKIEKVIKEITRISRQALIFLEWNYFDSGDEDPDGLGVYHHGLWKRNYSALLKRFARNRKIRITKIDSNIWAQENWSNVGAIIEAYFEL